LQAAQALEGIKMNGSKALERPLKDEMNSQLSLGIRDKLFYKILATRGVGDDILPPFKKTDFFSPSPGEKYWKRVQVQNRKQEKGSWL